MSRDREAQEHPAYGMINASRVTGQARLFGVDYPQHSFVRIELFKAQVKRDISIDWYHPKEMITSVDMSEVQFARLIATMNTPGVPCTLVHYRDPLSGKPVRTAMHERTIHKGAEFSNEVRERGEVAAKCVDGALDAARKMASGDAPMRKGALAELVRALEKAQQELSSNISYTVEEAERAIDKAVEAGKAEIEAFSEHVLREVGRTAILEGPKGSVPRISSRKD